MDRSRWPQGRLLRVTRYAEGLAVLCASGAPVRVWSADCEAYYRVMGRRPAEIWRNAMAVEEGFQLDTRCCFGSAADAAKCVRVSNFLTHEALSAMAAIDARYPTRDPRVLEWQARRIQQAADAGLPPASQAAYAALHTFGMYVDDGLGGSIDDLLFDCDGAPVLDSTGQHMRRASAHFEALRETLARYGHRSAPIKEQPPSTQVTALGVRVDVSSGRLYLTQEKCERYSASIDAACAAESLSLQELQRLLGRLMFAAACYPRGRQWLNPVQRLARVHTRRRDGNIVLTGKAVDALRTWQRAMQAGGDVHAGVPLACPAELGPVGSPQVGTVYADASGQFGYGAWTAVGDEVWAVRGEWSARERDEFLICDKELFASSVGLATFAPRARWRDIYSFTDNTVAMSAMRKLTPATLPMQQMTAERVDWMLHSGIREASERVSSKSNLWADLISREGGWGPFCLQVAALGYHLRELQPPAEWRSISQFSTE